MLVRGLLSLAGWLAGWLVGVWVGFVVCLGVCTVPLVFGVLARHNAACCVVLLHGVCFCEHVCAATGRVLEGAKNISYCRPSEAF